MWNATTLKRSCNEREMNAKQRTGRGGKPRHRIKAACGLALDVNVCHEFAAFNPDCQLLGHALMVR
jgi:hypothetical protein